MGANSTGLVGAPDKIISPPIAPQGEGLGERVLDRICEAICGLSGHESMLQFSQDRMFLKCVSCGHESPGWALKKASPTPIGRTGAPPRAMISSELVGARKVA